MIQQRFASEHPAMAVPKEPETRWCKRSKANWAFWTLAALVAICLVLVAWFWTVMLW